MFNEKIFNHYQAADPFFAQFLKRIPAHVFKISRPENSQEQKLALFKIIVDQQLSTSVALIIWQRIEAILKRDNWFDYSEELFKAGLSRRKISYLQNVDNINFSQLALMEDEAIFQTLTERKGVGPWTAEMALIFIYARADVFSFSDLILKKGMERLYGKAYKDHSVFFEEKIESFSPYRTTAALALWSWYDKKLKDSSDYLV